MKDFLIWEREGCLRGMQKWGTVWWWTHWSDGCSLTFAHKKREDVHTRGPTRVSSTSGRPPFLIDLQTFWTEQTHRHGEAVVVIVGWSLRLGDYTQYILQCTKGPKGPNHWCSEEHLWCQCMNGVPLWHAVSSAAKQVHLHRHWGNDKEEQSQRGQRLPKTCQIQLYLNVSTRKNWLKNHWFPVSEDCSNM